MSDDVTTFDEMYDVFLSKITDDMYMEMTKEDTEQLLHEILEGALTHVEFPKWKKPFELDEEHKCFYDKLTNNEKMMLSCYMVYEWLGYQLANVDLVRQKYSGSTPALSFQQW